MNSIKKFLEYENLIKNYGIIITASTIVLWILSGLREISIIAKWGISFKLLEFGLLDTFVFLVFNFAFILSFFALPSFIDKLGKGDYPTVLKVEIKIVYFIISLVFAIYTHGLNKEYMGIINKYPNITSIAIFLIGIIHFQTYIESIPILTGKTTRYDISHQQGFVRTFFINLIQCIQQYYSYFLISVVDYGLIYKISNNFENIIFNIRFFKRFIYFLSSVGIVILLLFNILFSMISLNYPNGSQYDYIEIGNKKYVIIGEYKGNFIIADYYKVESLDKRYSKNYSEYDYVINTAEYSLIKIENQKLGKVDIYNAYIEKKVKIGVD